MWPFVFPAWLLRLTKQTTGKTSPKLAAVQAAMLTGAFAMGAATMGTLQQSTPDAQAALESTPGEAGAIDAIRTIGMANLEARATLRAESHPDQPLEHRATYAILDYTKHENETEEIRARYAKQRRQVLRALYRSYHHERLQLESLEPRDEAQRLLIEQRLSELPDAEASLAEMIGDDTPLDVPDTDPEAELSQGAGISQALGLNTTTTEPDTVATAETVADSVVEEDPAEPTAKRTVFDRELAQD